MPRVLPVVILLVFAGSLGAQPPARTHDITPADYFTLATVTELAVSPDGKQVAYCVATWDKDADNRKTDLWVVATDGKGKPRQLTSDRANDRHPKWSADGKAVYVLANRKAEGDERPTAQVWRVPVEGEAVPVTKADGGVVAFDYAPKSANEAVLYTTDTTTTDADDFTDLRKKAPNLEYGHGKRTVSVLWQVTADGIPERVLDEKRYIREFAVSPGGSRVAMITAPDDTVIRSEGDSRVDLLDMATPRKVTTTDQGWKQTAGSPWPWLESLAWNPHGTKLAYCTIFDAYPAEIIICESKNGEWPAARMPRRPGTHVRGYGSPLRWNEFDGLLYLGEKDGAVFPVNYNSSTGQSGSAATWAGKVVYATHRAGKQSVVVAAVEADEFPNLYAVDSAGLNPVRLTDLNPQAKTWKLPSVEHITWKAPDGAPVGGALELPYGYKKGEKKLPLVVAMHGGPTTASHAALEFDPHNGRLYFAAAGYAVLCPNYRGSTGYGDKFVTGLIGRENDVEVKDIIAGIQHLIDQGIADPDRIAVMGWSNGGYLTNCLISLKDPPFKIRAASSGAGIVDTVAEWGFNDEPAYPRVFKKGLPWETPDIYRKTSPTYQLGNVKTPTLIHVGGNDERCPPGHSRMLHRALKEYVKVPTELIVYPGEPHGLTKYANRKAKMEWDLAWFDKYVKKN